MHGCLIIAGDGLGAFEVFKLLGFLRAFRGGGPSLLWFDHFRLGGGRCLGFLRAFRGGGPRPLWADLFGLVVVGGHCLGYPRFFRGRGMSFLALLLGLGSRTATSGILVAVRWRLVEIVVFALALFGFQILLEPHGLPGLLLGILVLLFLLGILSLLGLLVLLGLFTASVLFGFGLEVLDGLGAGGVGLQESVHFLLKGQELLTSPCVDLCLSFVHDLEHFLPDFVSERYLSVGYPKFAVFFSPFARIKFVGGSFEKCIDIFLDHPMQINHSLHGLHELPDTIRCKLTRGSAFLIRGCIECSKLLYKVTAVSGSNRGSGKHRQVQRTILKIRNGESRFFRYQRRQTYCFLAGTHWGLR